MTTIEAPPCANHGSRAAVGIIRTDTGRDTYVCEMCADRFWSLTDSPTVAATLSYLRLIG